MKVFLDGFLKNYTEAYLELSQTSSWKHQAGAFLKIVNELQILTI